MVLGLLSSQTLLHEELVEESSLDRGQPGSCEPTPALPGTDPWEQHRTLLCLGTKSSSWHLAGSCSRRVRALEAGD